MSNNILNIKDEIKTIFYLYYNNDSINEITNIKLLNADLKVSYTNKINTVVSKIKDDLKHNNLEYDVQLICENGYYFSTDKNQKTEQLLNYKNKIWYMEALESGEDIYWLSSLSIENKDSSSRNVFSAIRVFRDTNNKPLAFLMINVNERLLYSKYDVMLENESNIYFVDKEGVLVSHSTESMVGRAFYNMITFNDLFKDKNYEIIQKSSQEYLFSRYVDKNQNWIVVEEIPMKTILSPLTIIKTTVFSIAIIVFAFGFLISVFISRIVTKSFSKINNTMKIAQNGNFNIKFKKYGFTEAREISQACEVFLSKIQTLVIENQQKEEYKRKAELDFLRSQINPHFMNNTLFSIKCMVDMNKNKQACEMLDSLSGLLKNILDDNSERITIENEVILLKQYTYILQQRYGDAFKIEFKIEPSTNDNLILRFLLQPIIENAIYHGINMKKNNGVITVETTSTKDRLIVKIIDNGCGMPYEEQEKLFNEKEMKGHIGLINVYKRIKLQYGEQYGIFIESVPDNGTTVNLIFPNEKE